MEDQSACQHCQESAKDVWKDPEEGLGLQKGQHPQPCQVQEAYVREAEENQHAHQYSGGQSIQEGEKTRYQYFLWPLYI